MPKTIQLTQATKVGGVQKAPGAVLLFEDDADADALILDGVATAYPPEPADDADEE